MERNITDLLSENFAPRAALIVYTNESREPAYRSHDKRYYLETRPVKEDGSLGCAKPVTKKFIREMVQAFRLEGEKLPHGPIPENLLFAEPALGKERYVWWNPPMKRKMYFTSAIPMEEAEYHVPGTIYCARGDRLEVFCFEGKRPRPNGDLLFGPFYNYYADGGICLGSARVPWPQDLTWQALLDRYEKLFWDSANSHMMHNPMTEGYNLNLALKDAIDKPFDTKTLKKYGKKISSLL